jgi:hypothetical protein
MGLARDTTNDRGCHREPAQGCDPKAGAANTSKAQWGKTVKLTTTLQFGMVSPNPEKRIALLQDVSGS